MKLAEGNRGEDLSSQILWNRDSVAVVGREGGSVHMNQEQAFRGQPPLVCRPEGGDKAPKLFSVWHVHHGILPVIVPYFLKSL